MRKKRNFGRSYDDLKKKCIVIEKLAILTVKCFQCVCSLLAWMWKRRRVSRGRASWHNNKQETLNIGKTTQKDSSMKRVELEGELKLLQKIRQQLRGSLQSPPCWWTSWALSWYPVGQICVYAWMDVKKGVIECDWSLFKNATISIEFYYHSLMLSCITWL